MIHPRQIIKFARYLGVFARELVVANYQVVRLVLSPVLRIKPGFITVPMDAKTDFEITSLANSITLTPGTISVHVPHDRHAIVIHAINIGEDPNELRDSIKQVLEASILNWTRKDGFVAAKGEESETVPLGEATSPDNIDNSDDRENDENGDNSDAADDAVDDASSDDVDEHDKMDKND